VGGPVAAGAGHLPLAPHRFTDGRRAQHAGLQIGPNGDRPFNRNSAGEQWRRIRAAAGLTDFTLHDLRHFYASGLIASGCDVVTVQRALGHSSATITLGVYSHLWPTAEDPHPSRSWRPHGRRAADFCGLRADQELAMSV
jgi:integrase